MSAAGRVLRIGLVGAGRIGRMHAGLLAREVEGATLAALADIRGDVATELGQAWGVPVLDTDELLTREDLDAVAICSSTDTHVDLVVQAAHAGKPVFCEKPLSLDLSEARRAVESAEAAGVPLMVGFNRRFDPAHEAVRRAVDSGEIGEVRIVRVTSRDPSPPSPSYVAASGGIFLDMTIHDFDIARYVTRSEVTEVYALGAVRVAPWFGELGDVDTAIVLLVHENGCLSVIDNSRQCAYGFDQRVEVFGSKGVAAAGNPPLDASIVRTEAGGRLAPLHSFFIDRYQEAFVRQWRAFVTSLTTGTPVPVTGVDGLAPIVIALAAQRSLEERRPVAIAPPDEPEADWDPGRALATEPSPRRSSGS